MFVCVYLVYLVCVCVDLAGVICWLYGPCWSYLLFKERMERGSRKRSSSAGSEKMERVGGR